MSLSRTIFISNPEDTRYRGGLYQFKRDNPNDDTVYYCNGETARVRALVNKILDGITDPEILELIAQYGGALVDEARGDWNEEESRNV